MPAGPIKIAPSVLAADFGRLAEQVARAESAGADWIHVDVMDGHFVPSISIGLPIVRALRRRTGLPLDVHLMVDPVEPQIEPFAQAGADIITIHVEASRDARAALRQIRALGKRAGLTLRPGTDESTVWPYLADIDVLLVMTVEPGAGGQPFQQTMLPRIESLAGRLRTGGSGAELEVDGGISAATAPGAVRAGARVLVAGSAVFGAPEGIADALTGLRAAAAAALPGSLS